MAGPQLARWCFTLNNFECIVDYYKLFSDGKYNIKRCVWGVEKGSGSNTRHLQGYIEFSRSYRISYCKQLLPRAHFESARGTAKQNYDYCTKDGAFQTYGDWNFDKRANGSSEYSKAEYEHRCILYGLLSANRECVKNSLRYISRKRQYDERARELSALRCRWDRFTEYKDKLLRGWQMSILRRLFNQSTREILWVYDIGGGRGKSFLAHYLNSVYNYELFDGVTAAKDIAFLLSDRFSGIVFDVTRDNAQHFSYNTLEMCKNGFVMSGKYNGIKRMFRVVPVIVFANFEPDRSKLSADRWSVCVLDGWKKTPNKFSPEALWPFEAPPKFEEEKISSQDVSSNDAA